MQSLMCLHLLLASGRPRARSIMAHKHAPCPGPVHLLLCVSQRGLLLFSPLCKDRSWAGSMSSGAVCVGGKGPASHNFAVP